MRSSQHFISTKPINFAWKNGGYKLFSVHNRSESDLIYLQFGPNPGHVKDAWQVPAGQVWTMDPTAPDETIWIWSSVDEIDNAVLLG